MTDIDITARTTTETITTTQIIPKHSKIVMQTLRIVRIHSINLIGTSLIKTKLSGHPYMMKVRRLDNAKNHNAPYNVDLFWSNYLPVHVRGLSPRQILPINYTDQFDSHTLLKLLETYLLQNESKSTIETETEDKTKKMQTPPITIDLISVNQIQQSTFFAKYYVTFTKWFRLGSLDCYLERRCIMKTDKHRQSKPKLGCHLLKSILFQILTILKLIHDTFPSFRFNDLHLGNILLEKKGKGKKKTSSAPAPDDDDDDYKHNGVNAKEDNTNINNSNKRQCRRSKEDNTKAKYELKVSVFDLDRVSIDDLRKGTPEMPVSDSVLQNRLIRYGISCRRNQYYDIHTVCNHMICCFADILPLEIVNFLALVVPVKYRSNQSGVYHLANEFANDEYLTPTRILSEHSDFFASCSSRSSLI